VTATQLRPDPPVRRDRICARPDCPKPLVTPTPQHRKYGGTAILSEPFCSTECCKLYHGVIVTPAPPRPCRTATR
jgi:hypothetical protein